MQQLLRCAQILDDLLITRGSWGLLGIKGVCHSTKKGTKGAMILNQQKIQIAFFKKNEVQVGKMTLRFDLLREGHKGG